MLILAPACRSATPDRALGAPIQGAVLGGGIGCDVCAIAVVADVTTKDTDGVALSGVEVWWMPTPPAPEGAREVPVRARRLGTTDGDGRLVAPECPMGSSEFRFSPPGATFRFELMLFREDYSAVRVVKEVPTGEVLRSGYVLGTPMGDPLKHGYLLQVVENLHPVK